MWLDFNHDDEVIDPRHMGTSDEDDEEDAVHDYRFSVNGRTLTITRIDEDKGRRGLYLRVYRKSTEDIPDFTSTVYTYWGLRDECAPKDTTVVIIHPSVTTIKGCAFEGCKSLVRVTIPDTVTRI